MYQAAGTNSRATVDEAHGSEYPKSMKMDFTVLKLKAFCIKMPNQIPILMMSIESPYPSRYGTSVALARFFHF
jgi:hypothetical protein